MSRQWDRLPIKDAKRIALAAQGFAKPRPAKPTTRHLLGTIDCLSLHQIDSVNVLARAHYLPAFSRLGAYDRNQLDMLAWGPRSKRRLFEYWGHEASLLPLQLYRLFRWRMAQADRGETGWKTMRSFAAERRGEAEAILARIRHEGALAASDFDNGKGTGGWWEWGEAKHALEWLFWAGHVTTAYRRRNFERVYDLTERVIPDAVLQEPVPVEAEAHRELVARAAKALGVATAGDLRDYFRLKPQAALAALAELVEAKVLIPVRVEGWKQQAYLHSEAQRVRKVRARALLAPFDPLVWERSRTERLFGFRYRIEIYTPAANRVHGYYVLPFLLDENLVARVDLKADRQSSRLIVRQATVEPGAPPDTLAQLADELAELASWLKLEQVCRE
jgi:uncharacterized protein